MQAPAGTALVLVRLSLSMSTALPLLDGHTPAPAPVQQASGGGWVLRRVQVQVEEVQAAAREMQARLRTQLKDRGQQLSSALLVCPSLLPAAIAVCAC